MKNIKYKVVFIGTNDDCIEECERLRLAARKLNEHHGQEQAKSSRRRDTPSSSPDGHGKRRKVDSRPIPQANDSDSSALSHEATKSKTGRRDPNKQHTDLFARYYNAYYEQNKDNLVTKIKSTATRVRLLPTEVQDEIVNIFKVGIYIENYNKIYNYMYTYI